MKEELYKGDGRAKKKSGGVYRVSPIEPPRQAEAPMAKQPIPQQTATEEEKLDDIEKRIEALKRRLDER